MEPTTSTTPQAERFQTFAIKDLSPSIDSIAHAKTLNRIRPYWFEKNWAISFFPSFGPVADSFSKNLVNYESIRDKLLENHHSQEWVLVYDDGKKITFFGKGLENCNEGKKFVQTLSKMDRQAALLICAEWEQYFPDDPDLNLLGFKGQETEFTYLLMADVLIWKSGETTPRIAVRMHKNEGKEISATNFAASGSKKKHDTKFSNNHHIGGTSNNRFCCTLFVCKEGNNQIGIPLTFIVDTGCPLTCVQKDAWEVLEVAPKPLTDKEKYVPDGYLCIGGMNGGCKVIVPQATNKEKSFYADPDSRFVGINVLGYNHIQKLGFLCGELELYDESIKLNFQGAESYTVEDSNYDFAHFLPKEKVDKKPSAEELSEELEKVKAESAKKDAELAESKKELEKKDAELAEFKKKQAEF